MNECDGGWNKTTRRHTGGFCNPKKNFLFLLALFLHFVCEFGEAVRYKDNRRGDDNGIDEHRRDVARALCAKNALEEFADGVVPGQRRHQPHRAGHECHDLINKVHVELLLFGFGEFFVVFFFLRHNYMMNIHWAIVESNH